MKGSVIFHICNLSPKIIFRNEEDFIISINRLASSAYSSNVEILAYSIMSTHFHIIAKGCDESHIINFIRLYKRSINAWHNKMYSASQRLIISKRALNNLYEITTAVNYVLKNPIHHNVVEVPFKYPYSSINCYFYDELNRDDYFIGERRYYTYNSPNELSTRKYRYLFGANMVPDNWQLISKRMVRPESFVKIEYVQILYANAKTFLYNMNKPLKEEVEAFADDINSRNAHMNKAALYGKLTDIEVCNIIDNHICPKSYTQITNSERAILWEIVRKMGVDTIQFNRAT